MPLTQPMSRLKLLIPLGLPSFDDAVPSSLPGTFEPPDPEKVFGELMAERMHEKKIEYGPLDTRFPEKVHAIETALSRMDAYVSSGNTAHLIDAANFLMIEFAHPSHPIAHMQPLGPGDSPEQILRDAASD